MSAVARFVVGDTLQYTRTNGDTRTGEVVEVIDLREGDTGRRGWPYPIHCRFVYRLIVPGLERLGRYRTVCDHRLSEAPKEDLNP